VWRESDEAGRDLEQARKIAKMMDSQFSIGGFEFGWDAIMGLVPGIGDTIALLPALFPLYVAKKHNLPRTLIARMTMNVIVDAGVGLVPVAGDLFDAAFKASIKNVRLLEQYYEKHHKKNSKVVDGEVIG